MALKLVSINIQGHYHLEQRVLPLLAQEQPEVICLQEVFEADLPLIQQAYPGQLRFVPMTLVATANPHLDPHGRLGVVILVREESISDVLFFDQAYVQWPGSDVPYFFANDNPNSMNRVLLWVTFRYHNQAYCVATTHFTWSTEGTFTAEQARDFTQLRQILDKLPPHILCGDFNSPRQSATDNVYHQLEARYQSWVPVEVTSTLDEHLHKVGHLNFTVDGLFSSPNYVLSEVEVRAGISDHKAILATVNQAASVE